MSIHYTRPVYWRTDHQKLQYKYSTSIHYTRPVYWRTDHHFHSRSFVCWYMYWRWRFNYQEGMILISNWENRNGPDLVQAFPKKWWVESDFTVPNLPLPLRLKGSRGNDIDIFNRFNTATFMCLFQVRTRISKVICHGLICVQSFETIINDGFS
jgi:hypothetical protein